VDGYEYDPFFVEVAHLLNAYNSTTRVSFFERDITAMASYGGRYDVVMAFSVWTYVAPLLSMIHDMTDVFLVETHNLNGNLEQDYVRILRRFFPHIQALGKSDWGRTQDPSGGRAVMVCATSLSALNQVLLTGGP